MSEMLKCELVEDGKIIRIGEFVALPMLVGKSAYWQFSTMPSPLAKLVDGVWVDPTEVELTEIFEDKRADAIRQVDADAEATRKLYLTAGEGQAMTYDAKAQEAKAYLAAGSPVAEDYPFLDAEATATGQDIAVVAATVNAKRDYWIAKGAEIEGLRKGAHVAIAAVAVGDEDALLAATNIDWPSP